MFSLKRSCSLLGKTGKGSHMLNMINIYHVFNFILPKPCQIFAKSLPQKLNSTTDPIVYSPNTILEMSALDYVIKLLKSIQGSDHKRGRTGNALMMLSVYIECRVICSGRLSSIKSESYNSKKKKTTLSFVTQC